MNVRELEPKIVWNFFEDLIAVPRPSKKEEKIIEFMMNFGHSLELETYKDPAGNVIIRKPASKGMELVKQSFCRVIWIWFIRKMKRLYLIF